MNTAIRAIAAQGVRVRLGKIGVFRATLRGVVVTFFVFGVLLSALGVIYMKDLNRRLFIQYQALQAEKAQSLIQWGKLLLEQSTWSTQLRIQQIAQKQLGMIVPSAKDIVLVESNDADAAR
ncbi:cell division protein FtsL [Candidiatus Paracoxiella cheracis]|uniref:cell division protein FtsL n=1 Tax=Candidiatus Paracoxiella cheracis TaxID=3405120 RepID=UPI003BF5B900